VLDKPKLGSSESHLLGKVGNFGRKRLDSSSDSLNKDNVLEKKKQMDLTKQSIERKWIRSM